MAWYSLLPDHLTIYETWIVRTFLFLAIFNMSPWLLAILYDFVLWICRSIWYEIPGYGGRAQGEQRPRAPSIADRPRRMSIANLVSGRHSHSRTQSYEDTTSSVSQLRKRDRTQEQVQEQALKEED